MGSLRSFFIIIALGVILGPCVFVAADDAAENATQTSSPPPPSPSASLHCLICNDALGNDYVCKDPKTETKGEKALSLPCGNLDEFLAANVKLRNLHRAGEGETEGSLKMATKYASKKGRKLGYENAAELIGFACRLLTVEIKENDDNKDKRLKRTVGSCGIYHKQKTPEHEHDDSKMECMSKAGSAKTKFISCKCDTENCNGAGRLSQGFTAVLALATFIGLLGTFKGIY